MIIEIDEESSFLAVTGRPAFRNRAAPVQAGRSLGQVSALKGQNKETAQAYSFYMQELLEIIAKALVNNPDVVTVNKVEEDSTLLLELKGA